MPLISDWFARRPARIALMASILCLLLAASLPQPQLQRKSAKSREDSAPDETSVVHRGRIKKVLFLEGELRAVKSRAVFATTS